MGVFLTAVIWALLYYNAMGVVLPPLVEFFILMINITKLWKSD